MGVFNDDSSALSNKTHDVPSSSHGKVVGKHSEQPSPIEKMPRDNCTVAGRGSFSLIVTPPLHSGSTRYACTFFC